DMTSTSSGRSLISSINNPTEERSIIWHVPHYSPQHGKPASAIRKGKFKLIYFYEDKRAELYNLESDPSEENDLSESQPLIASELMEELDAWKAQRNAKEPVPNPDYQGG
ncbi:MAG: sulfatase/phosphatase domain-containing protein, partial [Bacteroidota bacterium]